jgi:predicted transcriptional regulator
MGEKRDQFRQDALAAWAHCQTTGLHATAEEADAWLATLEAGEAAAPPECHD